VINMGNDAKISNFLHGLLYTLSKQK